jgi:hypothetical protein
MKDGFRAGREKKLLAFFTEHFNQLSPTAEVKILGGIGYVTQDPENIEALLSTQFQGQWPESLFCPYTRASQSNRRTTQTFILDLAVWL